MQKFTKFISGFFLIVVVLFTSATIASAVEEKPIVHAVLFFSPTCGHCHQVINQDLPALLDQYGEQLQIAGVNTQTTEGQALYQAVVDYFELPDERLGVPALVVGDTVLVGSFEIPNEFPGIIARGLESDGIPWPNVPGLADSITAAAAKSTSQAEASNPIETNPQNTSALEKARGLQALSTAFKQDLVGNSASVIVLVAIIISTIRGLLRTKNIPDQSTWKHWRIPALALIGLGVSGYLSYVELTQTSAVCGPVGDCNAVQQSPYARLFGVLPVGVLGLAGYVFILIAWAIQQYGRPDIRLIAGSSLWGSALFGSLFSIYLTFLEPFVIGATCAWCLTSAILISGIFWLTSLPKNSPISEETPPA